MVLARPTRANARRSRLFPQKQSPRRLRSTARNRSNPPSSYSNRFARLPEHRKPESGHSDAVIDVAKGIPHPRQSFHLENAANPGPFPSVEDKPDTVKHAFQTKEAKEIYNVPLPVPVTPTSTKSHGFGYAMVNAVPNTTHVPSKATSSATPLPAVLTKGLSAQKSFSPLPPLPSLTSNVMDASSDELGSSTSFAVPSTTLSENLGEGTTQNPHKIGVATMILLSVGLVCLSLGVYVVCRFWSRRRRVGRIKPSLPIPEKAYTFDEHSFNREGKESPVFGGKDRSASRLGAEGPLWTWVQYSKPELKDPTRLSSLSSKVHDEPYLPATHSSDSPPGGLLLDDRRESTIIAVEPTQHNAALAYAANRLSTASSTFCRNRDSRSVPTAITGDGYPILERSRSRIAARRSQSHSVLADRRRRDSAYRPDSAYDGADVSTPTTYFQPMTTPKLGGTPNPGPEGRERIQSSYYAVAQYPRLSSMPASYSIGTARKVHISNAYASERRDTDAGATQDQESPLVPPSPGATLYPDDSMSVIASMRQKRRSQCDAKRQSKFLNLDTTASSKGLLEMDFGVSRMSISELAEGADTRGPDAHPPPFQTNVHGSERSQKAPGGTRPYDRPPRVPSPPPLPSLAQMALAHGNPEGYGNYRSPTYSIYGLYGNDRKSAAHTPGAPLP